MKLVLSLCLVALAASASVPDIGHPNARLIDEAKNMMTQMSSRIMYGEDAQIRDFPWQVSLRRRNSHICGAVIVADTFVVTAAHCVDGVAVRDLSLSVGTASLSSGGTVHSVARKVIHNDWNPNSGLANDIAVLETTAVMDGTNVGKALLPDVNNDYSGNSCIISGWGVTENGGLSDILKKANTKVISNSQCSVTWGGNINDGNVCVFTGDNGACNGDSGGPLTIDNVLIGVTSWGANGCHPSYPSVYTRISYFRSWIESITNPTKTFK